MLCSVSTSSPSSSDDSGFPETMLSFKTDGPPLFPLENGEVLVKVQATATLNPVCSIYLSFEAFRGFKIIHRLPESIAERTLSADLDAAGISNIRKIPALRPKCHGFRSHELQSANTKKVLIRRCH
ncbi:hypothetical protein CPB85DRAFT_1273713 [Mucidula mucida]|nr:hypothetical protein CPB85DRAFT_1273713 [Mucidula mucida]